MVTQGVMCAPFVAWWQPMAKYDDPEYLLRRVITHSTRARTLIHAVRHDYIGDKSKRRAEADELITEAIGYLKKVLDTIEVLW